MSEINKEYNRDLTYRGRLVGCLDSTVNFNYLIDNFKQNLPSVIENFDGDDTSSLMMLVSKHDKIRERQVLPSPPQIDILL